MNSNVFGFLAVLLLIIVVPIADAQISVGQKAAQKLVEVHIDLEGNVHVKHFINPLNLPGDLKLIPGIASNISVTNEEGEELLFTTSDGNSMVLVQPSNVESIVEYDLDHVLSKIDNVWTWDFLYLETTNFYLPEEVKLFFVNERAVYLGEEKGIACHGCDMFLEYSINKPKTLENVNWEDNKFLVEIQSNSNIDKFIFDQTTKSITFDILKENQFVTIIIPLELLWKPYSVFLDDEKIFFQEFINNGTHVWLNMKPETTGEITIIGTTVIPEFPIIAPLAIGFLMILVIPLMKKVNLH